MKNIILLILAIFILISFCEAAPVKPREYKIAVTTKSNKTYRGVFYSINDTLLQLKKRNKIISFKAANVKNIAVYNAKLPLTIALAGAAVCIITATAADNEFDRTLGYITFVPVGLGVGYIVGELANEKAAYWKLDISDFSSISDKLKPFSIRK